jgi:heme exporter protein A
MQTIGQKGTKVKDMRLTGKGLSLRKGYNLLISNLNFEVLSAEILCLKGANGVGKTTLLRTLAGFLTPESGEIIFSHEKNTETEALLGFCHYLGHQDCLSPSLRVEQELIFQSAYLGGHKDAIDMAVDRLNLKPLLSLETRMLSAGQKRRLSFARLLMVDQPVWLMDEPMSPLDETYRGLCAELMQAHLKSGGMIICAVHDDLPFQAKSLTLVRPRYEPIPNLEAVQPG